MTSSGDSQVVLVQVEPPVGFLTINRPEQRNAMNLAVWEGLIGGVEKLDKDQDVRAIVVRGGGARARRWRWSSAPCWRSNAPTSR